MFLTTCQLDWLSVIDFDMKERLFNLGEQQPSWVRATGGNGYDSAFKEELTGVLMYKSTKRKDMGALYNLSGQPLTLLLNFFATPHRHEAAVECGMAGLRASRVDLAIDYYDEGNLAHKFASAVEERLIKTKLRKKLVLREIEGMSGVTTYIGGGASPRRLRVYDKCVESKGLINSTRIEIQTRGKHAAFLWNAIQSMKDYERFAGICRTAIKSTVECEELQEYNAIIQGESEMSWPKRHSQNNTKLAWLVRQVMPTFLDDYAVNSQHTLLEQFVSIIDEATGTRFRY